MKQYDYLVVGAGLFGSVFAYKAQKADKGVWLLINVLMLVVMCIVRILRV